MWRSVDRRLALVGILSLALAGLTACGDGDDDGGTGPSTIAGTYNLETINGVSVPVTVYEDADELLELLSGRVTIDEDGTYSESTRWRYTAEGSTITADEPSNGTWTRQGDAITFFDSDGGSTGGTLQGNTLTVVFSEEGVTLSLRYVK